ncbi:MAG: efflux RND transporter periplasmic adaptor subunit [Hydrogenophaga sp.]|jgi:HlyD family secretion protein|uniref:HlyD family secretion protein n=1 Tax=Hydrogenophaga sp. TaxID=1904254 RepID=UPI000EC736DD|nr:efflux RND transporter periplasmic adaptor subunit [Hydrogenophaga sp.]MDX9968227.1 efflux RND transporter periplasmic adaptor subunit [Hydrogenophaga sp.]HAJ11598.1 hemolysin D [Comamonadaceae bacterium]
MSARLKPVLALLLIVLIAALVWRQAPWRQDAIADAFVSGNGRIEGTEIAVASRLPGRLQEVLVGEGDFVKAGQVLARLQMDSLEAQRAEALARLQQARQALGSARAQVAQAQSNHQAAQAAVVQRETDLDSARRRLPRVEKLAADGFYADQTLDDERARVRSLAALLSAAQAQARAAEAGIGAAEAQVAAAQANLDALQATLQRIDVELADSELKAPRDGRVQFLVAHPGEIVAGGGRVLNLVDLGDVYMTFFLPETVAGRVALGSEVRIVLDAAPQVAIPARVSFVASTAQFTPKTVETASERQKLMFRVRAQVDRALLQKYKEQVKTGLPGVAWIRLDDQADWPPFLSQVLRP